VSAGEDGLKKSGRNSNEKLMNCDLQCRDGRDVFGESPKVFPHGQYTGGSPAPPVPGAGYAVLRGKGIRIRGNTRTVRRQYAANEWASVRILPDIAGYCRVTGPGDFFTESVAVLPGYNHNMWGCPISNAKGKIDEGTGGSVRFGTPGNAWERLGTDKFFSPRENGEENCFGELWCWPSGTPPVVVCRNMPEYGGWGGRLAALSSAFAKGFGETSGDAATMSFKFQDFGELSRAVSSFQREGFTREKTRLSAESRYAGKTRAFPPVKMCYNDA
jgi:hypothetical protein